ncbi:MAG: MBL fold metallo-hydrolase [Firmicutes bacterium]|nr:MBL fold metallo-hydrolase [Bacillota bacterium]
MIARIYLDEANGCASYLIGDEIECKAAIVDPLDALGSLFYAEKAAALGMEIAWILETHIHADHRSCGRDLAALTGATVGISAQAPVRYPVHTLHEGEQIKLGSVLIDVLETPGHTPESLSFLVTDFRRSAQPLLLFSGDALFSGDVGRPDLVGGVENEEAAAKAAQVLFHTLQEKILPLPDELLVLPAHYGGSACGGLFMSGVPFTTLGYEKKSNTALQSKEEQSFVAHVLSLLKPPPREAVTNRAENLGTAIEA